MNNFQTILIAIFMAFFVFGVLIFSGAIKIGGSKSGADAISGRIVIWGDLPSKEVSGVFQGTLPDSGGNFSALYVEQNKDEYQQKLIEAFAKDEGPDLFILSGDMMLRNGNFTYKIPYTSISENTFRTNYIDGADILLTNDGISGFPLLVDPLVLYYNKDMLSNEGILYPPSTWDELFGLSSKLNKKKADGTLSQSMIALGHYANVNHYKEILSLLLLQSNNPIISRSNTGYTLNIKDQSSNGTYPLEQIISFFEEFSNPSKDSYSWNRSLPSSFDMFTSGKLAFYIGYGSELFKIQSVNPNLSFDVAMIPQTKGTNIKRTYGDMYSVVINKKSKNLASVMGVASLMNNPAFLKELAIASSLPTMNRSLLNDKPADSYLVTFFNSAIIARSWLDPDRVATDLMFKELIDNTLSNKLSLVDSIDKLYNQMDLIVRSYQIKK